MDNKYLIFFFNHISLALTPEKSSILYNSNIKAQRILVGLIKNKNPKIIPTKTEFPQLIFLYIFIVQNIKRDAKEKVYA